jgi:prephenate dehydrogenase
MQEGNALFQISPALPYTSTDTPCRVNQIGSCIRSKRSSLKRWCKSTAHVSISIFRIPTEAASDIFQATKLDAIVSGQTSVKAPEKEAFDKYLPADVKIVSVHSLHGPSVSPIGQPLV